MFIRALTVLLLFLNLGVAAWWLAQPAPAAHTPAVQVPGVPLLELASSAAAAAAPRRRSFSACVASGTPMTASNNAMTASSLIPGLISADSAATWRSYSSSMVSALPS